MQLDYKKHNLPEKSAYAGSAPIKTSVQKASLVSRLVQNMPIAEALLQLQFCRKKVAKDVLAVLRAAIANAENNFGYDIDKLYISRAFANKAFNLKRMRAAARGRGRSIQKYYSTVKVIVSERD
jgi:large subunit ribosomal protein L22